MTRLMGLDVGSKRIGVAVSDELGVVARPAGVVHRRSYNRDAAELGALIREMAVGQVVVGLPMGLSGRPTDQTRRTIRFAEMLASRIPVPVELWDERLTTVMARRTTPREPQARRSGQVDQAAAVIILQGFLDHQTHETDPLGRDSPQGLAGGRWQSSSSSS